MTQNSFPKIEEEILKFWQNRQIFKKSLDKPSPKGQFIFYDGPPFATGLPHYGHIIASAMKDVIPRYKTMQGFCVNRRWGWDCHGLPIENLIEKELELKTKKDIEKLGIDKFNQACRNSVLRYADEWKRFIPRMARWVDMDNDYRTMDNRYIEVIWWIFKEFYSQSLIYEGYKAMHLCPRCETTLSNFEVTLGYKEVKDLAVYVKFKVKSLKLKVKSISQKSNVYLLAWTTTPWTLPGNTALAIGENIKYQISNIKNEDGFFVIAKDCLEKVMKGKEYKIVDEVNGSGLIGLEYEPLFDFSDKEIKKDKNYQNAFKIYPADFVSTAEGTGIVHIAPGFGEDDYQLSQKFNIPFLQHVNRDGVFKDYVKPWAGQKVREKDDDQKINIEIIKWLAHHNQLFAKEKYLHSYPHCWRCDTPLLNYATSSWFVKIDDQFKKRLLKANAAVNWAPSHLKDGRFGKWLEGARDWAISRSRYWGAPMPVWRCENSKCGEVLIIGSVEELQKKLKNQNSKLKTTAQILKLNNLHRPDMDKIQLVCSKCNGKMRRISEVFDCWFESGSMPYASALSRLDGNLENADLTQKVDLSQMSRKDLLKHIEFPADFIAEGIDQTRGWFYTLLVLGVGLYNQSPFKNVAVNGIILAEDGQKMSKRLKNYPDPNDIINKYGADALRFYLLSSPAVRGESLNFSEKGVDEVYKKVVLLSLNVLKFWEMYDDQMSNVKCPARLASQCEAGRQMSNQTQMSNVKNILDQWILARLSQLIGEVEKSLDNYEIDKACRPITEFIADLSTWYLRRSRDRFKNQTIGIVGADLRVCPSSDEHNVLQILGYVLLEFSKIIAPICPFLAEHIYQNVKCQMSNVKCSESVHLEQWPVGADMRVCPNILENMQVVRQICEIGHSLRDIAGIKVRQVLKNFQFSIFNFQSISKDQFSIFKQLIADELNVKNIEIVEKLPEGEGWVSKEGAALYIVIDDELREEGIVRELTRQINNLRKKQGLTIKDKIRLEYAAESERLRQIIEKYKEELMQAVLAREIRQQENLKGYQLNVGADLVSVQNVEREEVVMKLGN